MIIFPVEYLLYVLVEWVSAAVVLCFDLAPVYDVFGVVSSGGLIVSAILEFHSSSDPSGRSLKLLKISHIMLQVRAIGTMKKA